MLTDCFWTWERQLWNISYPNACYKIRSSDMCCHLHLEKFRWQCRWAGPKKTGTYRRRRNGKTGEISESSAHVEPALISAFSSDGANERHSLYHTETWLVYHWVPQFLFPRKGNPFTDLGEMNSWASREACCTTTWNTDPMKINLGLVGS